LSDLVEFRKLKDLIVVAEEGNITRAAKRLYLAQPTLSKEIKDLEEELRVPLLIRHRKGVQPTSAGDILVAGGRELLKLRDGLIETVRNLHRVTFSPMRLGFSPFVDHALFEMVCSIHESLFPGCEIKPESGDPVDLLLRLDKGEIDAALVTLPVDPKRFKAHPFTQSRLVACMRADDPLAHLKEIPPSELQAKLTIFREPKQHPEAHRRLMEILAEVGVEGDVVSRNKTPLDLQWMVGSGSGYALIREGSDLQAGLVTRPIAGVTWTVDSALILGTANSHRTMPQVVKEMRKRLRLQASLPPRKPVRSVRATGKQSLPLFG
jgi:DNA-binding transcriptional LysR family regulator